jgi:hypothetical protein
VAVSGKRWQATICYDSTHHHLGTLETKQEAALAYDRQARQCGEDKHLNHESIKVAEETAAAHAQAQADRASWELALHNAIKTQLKL